MKVDENTGLTYAQWTAPSARVVLLLVHGLGAHSGRWEFLANFFLRQGVSAYALELRGFGRTKEARGHVQSLNIYFDDLHALHRIIQRDCPGRKIFILGESLGGLLAFLFSTLEPRLFAGLICLAPAFKSRLKFPLADYFKVFLSLLFNPRRQFRLPIESWMCTRDEQYRRVLEEDQQDYRFSSAWLLVNILMAQARVPFLKDKITLPALFLLAGRDFLVDSMVSAGIFKSLKTADKTLIRYPDMYHALSIDLGRQKVFEDILAWLWGHSS